MIDPGPPHPSIEIGHDPTTNDVVNRLRAADYCGRAVLGEGGLGQNVVCYGGVYNERLEPAEPDDRTLGILIQYHGANNESDLAIECRRLFSTSDEIGPRDVDRTIVGDEWVGHLAYPGGDFWYGGIVNLSVGVCGCARIAGCAIRRLACPATDFR